MRPVRELRERMELCRACSLYRNGQLVEARFGGNAELGRMDLMLVGEAPDRAATDRGIPFPPETEMGAMVEEWLKALCPSGSYVVTAAMKHYPMKEDGDWRTPTQEEIDACSPFLDAQIAVYRPKAILGVGDISFTSLTKRPTSEFNAAVEAAREYEHAGIPCLFYYHPGHIIYRDPKAHSQEKFGRLVTKVRELCGRA